jgi:hypothetical protein
MTDGDSIPLFEIISISTMPKGTQLVSIKVNISRLPSPKASILSLSKGRTQIGPMLPSWTQLGARHWLTRPAAFLCTRHGVYVVKFVLDPVAGDLKELQFTPELKEVSGI